MTLTKKQKHPHNSGSNAHKIVNLKRKERVLKMKNFDVIIVGGAYNGLALANILASKGLHVAMLEKRSLVYNKQQNEPSRLLAISDNSVEILKSAGVKDLPSIGQEINAIFVCDDDSAGELEFQPADVHLNNFGYMVEEHDLLKDLYKSKHKSIKLYENVAGFEIENKEDSVEIKIAGGDKISCSLLVGADGKNSYVREHHFVETFDHDYLQTAFVFDIKHEEKHEGLAVEKFKPNGPIALLPKKSGNESCIVWTVPSKLVESINSLEIHEIEELLADDIDDFFGGFEICSEIKAFPLMLRQSKEYFAENTVFIGDALHAIHPLAGQGLNLGLRDVHVLANLIIENKELGLPINSQVLLEKYKSARAGDINAMVQATHNLNTLFSNNFLPLRLARRFGLQIVDKIKPLKSVFMKYAVGSMDFQKKG